MFARSLKIRRGISLLEVLISMGILSVGLASVLALIPAGKSQAKRAAIEDGRGALGSSALEDCVNRGLLRKTLWQPSSTGAVVWDPLFKSLTTLDATFPAGLTPIKLSTIGTAIPPCDDVARGQDDLVFVVPENDDAAPPSPRFGNGKRMAEGHFSWLATLVPADTSPTPEYYRLSVVEFHKRPFDLGSLESFARFDSVDCSGASLAIPNPADPTAASFQLAKDAFSRFFKTGCVVLVSDGATNYRWLRVLMASPTETSDGTFVTSIDLTCDKDPGFTPSVLCAYAGAVGVAEKIVRLEGDSPWVTP